jgi:hypothetical protein
MALLKDNFINLSAVDVVETANASIGTPAAGHQKLFIDTDHILKRKNSAGTVATVGGGDVAGPGSATDGHLAVFDGTTGKLLKDGGAPTAGGLSADGWAAADALTYAASDAPTYTVTCAGDQTGKYSPGMRIKLTDSTVKYFIITAVAYTSSTTLTLYGGTDYTLSGGAITSPYYSSAKAPIGFPLSPAKWTVEVTDTTQRAQSSPGGTTWYNLGSISISVPIGVWHVDYTVVMEAYKSTATTSDMRITLSTANNSESDSQLTALYKVTNATDAYFTMGKRKVISAAAKTAYYLIFGTASSGPTDIYLRNDMVPAIIRATSAYL